MNSIFGIDLGTTNSCISWLNQGLPEVINIEGSPLVPSVVSFEQGQPIVGKRAANRAILYPEDTVASIKRSMGSEEKIVIQKDSYSPEQISSFILKYLKEEAAKVCQTEVKEAVITVPAYFSDFQRRATKEAGRLAGLEVKRIINEPTAAALFYDHLGQVKLSSRENDVLVYDLGGGTFDVSVLRMGEITEVLASRGNTHLGGDDFDQEIMQYCFQLIQAEYQLDLKEYRPALARIKNAAEKAKIALSTYPYTQIEEPLLPNPEEKNIDLNFELSRDELESFIDQYLQSTREEMSKALQESGIKQDGIEKVLLVGGSTRIPAVIRLLEEEFGSSRMPVVDPDLSVAKGAAIQGGIISGSHIYQVLIDVTSHTLSTEALMEDMHLECVPIIPRNTQIPVTRSNVFYTMAPEQPRVEVKVFQGESSKGQENTLIGTLDLALAPAPAYSPITIEYSYDLNGIIHVKVEQKGYSRKREVDLDAYKQNQRFLEVELDEEDQDLDVSADFEEQEEFSEQDEDQLSNYILQKARSVLDKTEQETQKTKLKALIYDYEQALKSGDDDQVDDAEDVLVDFLEDLED